MSDCRRSEPLLGRRGIENIDMIDRSPWDSKSKGKSMYSPDQTNMSSRRLGSYNTINRCVQVSLVEK